MTTRGVLIFAHNGKVDYGTQAVVSARYAKKYLGIPVSLVSDIATVDQIENDFGTADFDKIIVNQPTEDNFRLLKTDGGHELVEFKNSNRADAFSVTPYEQTLVIDSDLLVCNSSLTRYWDSGFDFRILTGSFDAATVADAPYEYKVSEHSINMLWATMMMFDKSDTTAALFELVDTIRTEYNYYAQLYEFDASKLRNDYIFSIACHMMSGMTGYQWFGTLPIPVLMKDSDFLVDAKSSNDFTFLTRDNASSDYFLTRVHDQNVHVINKRDLVDNAAKLISLL